MIANRVERRRPLFVAVLAVLLLCLPASRAAAQKQRLDGWMLERGVETPSYAVTEPASTNLNIDTIALVCEQGASRRIVQLQLYLSDAGPLAPRGVAASALKPYPRVEIAIDRRTFAAKLYFAGDHALVADSERERFPMLSDPLLDAMAGGRTMTLSFDLAAKAAAKGKGQATAFDGQAVINLQAGRGSEAVSAVRRCAMPAAESSIGAAHAAG